mmetsp:Transcript_44915/g.51920  ORF Transcript_44915/g.51920 Transcript_44915/m.51920 type:complete len:105 (-) Transcript_44915:127-441(-)
MTFDSTTGGADDLIQLQCYKADGTVNGSALTLGTTNGTTMGVVSADSSYSVLFEDWDSTSTNVTKGWVGKVFAATKDPILPAMGKLLKGVLTALSFLLLGVLSF